MCEILVEFYYAMQEFGYKQCEAQLCSYFTRKQPKQSPMLKTAEIETRMIYHQKL